MNHTWVFHLLALNRVNPERVCLGFKQAACFPSKYKGQTIPDQLDTVSAMFVRNEGERTRGNEGEATLLTNL